MRTVLLLIALASGALAEPPHTSLAAVPKGLRAPLSAAIPKKVWLTWYGEAAGVTTMRGNAVSIDDVSEFMRGLNNIVRCPKGLARVVERQRNGGFRVELVDRPTVVLEYAKSELSFPFAGLELKSAALKGDLVEFELTSRASP